MNNIVALIQARMGSTRLPDKVLFNLEGKTVLEHVIARVRRSSLIKEVIVATTFSRRDLKIVNLCSGMGIRVFCGSENDVLDRYYQASRLLETKHIVRITSDCPVIDPEIIDNVIKLHLSNNADYTTNTIGENFPDGQDVEIFTFAALKKAWEKARLLSEREHVTPYIKNHPGIFKIAGLEYQKDLSKKRWTLDEQDDYKFIKLIYKNLYKKNKFFGMEDILNFLKQYPEYENINYHIRRNEGYLKSIKQDKAVSVMGE